MKMEREGSYTRAGGRLLAEDSCRHAHSISERELFISSERTRYRRRFVARRDVACVVSAGLACDVANEGVVSVS